MHQTVYFTGQVNIESRISVNFSAVDGQISVLKSIFGVISQLFSTIFGRRLGTVDDGTSQRANVTGVDPDFDDSTSEHFTPKRCNIKTLLKLSQSSTLYNITSRGDTYLRGLHMVGNNEKIANRVIAISSSNMYSGTHTRKADYCYR